MENAGRSFGDTSVIQAGYLFSMTVPVNNRTVLGSNLSVAGFSFTGMTNVSSCFEMLIAFVTAPVFNCMSNGKEKRVFCNCFTVTDAFFSVGR